MSAHLYPHAGSVHARDWRVRVSGVFSEALGASSLALIAAVGLDLLGADRAWQGWLSVGGLVAWGALRAAKLL